MEVIKRLPILAWAVAVACACAVLAGGGATAAAATSSDSGGAGPGGTTQPPPPPPPPPPDHSKPKQVFPVRAAHSFGDGFGAPRPGYTHQGQDVLAPCKSTLVSVRAGRVKFVDFDSRGGWYVVIDNDGTGKDFVYMHMKKKVAVQPGEHVKAGEKIGMVGQTGDATGCHLHFEIWQGPWQQGGEPIDPLPKLRRWDRNS